MIRIQEYSDSWFDAVLELATDNEAAACEAFSALPPAPMELRHQTLSGILERGMGVIALDAGNQLLGVLGFTGPHSPFHGDHIGVYAPAIVTAVRGDNTDRVFTALFRAAAAQAVFVNVDTWAITAFAHDSALERSLAMNGFGARCADAVVAIDDIPDVSPPAGITIADLPWQDAAELLPLKQGLDHHLTQSPAFLPEFGFTEENVVAISERRQSRYIVAWNGDVPVAYVEFAAHGENYLTRHPQMMNICGAWSDPAWRGTGTVRALLSASLPAFREQGITTIGVDYETINPEARFFWERTFTPYTRSWERRKDRTSHLS